MYRRRRYYYPNYSRYRRYHTALHTRDRVQASNVLVGPSSDKEERPYKNDKPKEITYEGWIDEETNADDTPREEEKLEKDNYSPDEHLEL